MNAHKKFLMSAAMALAGVGANAHARTVIYANVEPPAMRVETVPAARPGYVWVGGNWGYTHHKYRWHGGHWVRARHGYHYAPARWERDGNRWRYYDGRWDR
jgi:hypothetical protein